MAVSRALRRLLSIRELEEELSKAALAAARSELTRLENALEFSAQRTRRGRELVGASIQGGDSADRLAGLEETRISAHLAEVLPQWIAGAEIRVNDLQSAHLGHHVRRRQAEALLENAESEEVARTARQSQQELDDWFLSRGLNREPPKERGSR